MYRVGRRAIQPDSSPRLARFPGLAQKRGQRREGQGGRGWGNEDQLTGLGCPLGPIHLKAPGLRLPACLPANTYELTRRPALQHVWADAACSSCLPNAQMLLCRVDEEADETFPRPRFGPPEVHAIAMAMVRTCIISSKYAQVEHVHALVPTSPCSPAPGGAVQGWCGPRGWEEAADFPNKSPLLPYHTALTGVVPWLRQPPTVASRTHVPPGHAWCLVSRFSCPVPRASCLARSNLPLFTLNSNPSNGPAAWLLLWQTQAAMKHIYEQRPRHPQMSPDAGCPDLQQQPTPAVRLSACLPVFVCAPSRSCSSSHGQPETCAIVAPT